MHELYGDKGRQIFTEEIDRFDGNRIKMITTTTEHCQKMLKEDDLGKEENEALQSNKNGFEQDVNGKNGREHESEAMNEDYEINT